MKDKTHAILSEQFQNSDMKNTISCFRWQKYGSPLFETVIFNQSFLLLHTSIHPITMHFT